MSTRLLAILSALILGMTAQAETVTSVVSGGPGEEISALLRVGTNSPGITLVLAWEDGSNTVLRFQATTEKTSRKIMENGKGTTVSVVLSNAVVECQPLRINLFVRPNLDIYPPAMKEEWIKKWDTLPPASGYEFPLALRSATNGVEVWIDGRYAGRIDRNSPLKSAVFKVSATASLTNVNQRVCPASRYLPLDISRMNRPGLMKGAIVRRDLKMTPGAAPLAVSHANIDVGLARELTGGGMETDPYLSRTAFDGVMESHLFSVPLDQYIRAWVLCAVEDDPPAKDPVLTARLTRFTSDGRGDAIADTTVWLPRGTNAPGPGIEKAGYVSYGGKRVPLWRVEIVLKPGDIQDLIFFRAHESYNDGRLADRRYLDFELLGKLGTVSPQHDGSHKPDKKSVSGVHVFAVTLERTPVECEVRQAQVGNIFQGNEPVELPVALRARQAGAYRLEYKIRNVDGEEAGGGGLTETLDPAMGEKTVLLPVDKPGLGWHGLDLELKDEKGRLLIRHEMAFAVLPADTRRAGNESPYGTWWFGSAHRGTDNKEIGGPLMLKAGLRHTNFGWHKLVESNMAPWKVTAFQIPWLWRAGTGDVAAAALQYEQAVSNYLAKWPSCTMADVFHESYGGDTIPPELRDGPAPVLTEEKAQSVRKRIEAATAVTKVLRKKFPKVKTLFGNSNPGASLVAEFFRTNYPAANIDYLGIEAAGQSFMPEKMTEYGTLAAWTMRETARKFGHEIPVSSCYEWLYRQERLLGPRRLAEWVVRDALIARAWDFPQISLMLLYDAGNCYYTSLWGGSGLCRRYPLLYPKPAYVAYANLTAVLDDVKLVRRVPTGSPTVYALEFERDNKRIYALWTPRGKCRTTFTWPLSAGQVKVIDLFGRSRVVTLAAGGFALDVDTSPCYVLANTPALTVRAESRSFPLDAHPTNAASFSRIKWPQPGVFLANAMDKPDEWQLAAGPDNRLEAPTNGCLPLRTFGTYALRGADDSEKGSCLELELVTPKPVPDVMLEYTLLNLRNPVPVPGKPTTVGVWVKGNSGWGRVMWGFEDAEGRNWLSCGTPGWGCDSLDWGGDISINFDGWCFLRFPITAESPVRVITPGGPAGQWVMTGGTNKTVRYPIKLTGLGIEMSKRALDLTEMKPVTPILRFKDLSAFEE